MTGKNFQPWKLPQVAMKRPGAAEWGEMMKSAEVVKASLWERMLAWTREEELGGRGG